MGGCFSAPAERHGTTPGHLPNTSAPPLPVLNGVQEPQQAQVLTAALRAEEGLGGSEQKTEAAAEQHAQAPVESPTKGAVVQGASLTKAQAREDGSSVAAQVRALQAARLSEMGCSAADSSPTPGISPAASQSLRGFGSANLASAVTEMLLTADQNLTIQELNQEIHDLAFIGQGASGAVYRGRWNAALVAIKYIVCQNLGAQEAATNEAALGRLLAHPNVVQTFSCKTAIINDEFNAQMRACIEEQLQGAYGIEEEEPQPPVSAAQVGVLTDSEAQRVAQQWAQAPAGAGGGGGEQQAAGTGQFAGGTQQGLPQAIMDGFHSGEGFGSPLGQPQSMLAIQEVLIRADAKIGFSLTQIIMEYCDKGSLLQAIDKGLFSPTSRWGARLALRALLRTAQEIALGMVHIHQCNVIHGDLKPGNVLLKSSRADRRGFVAKVADFGLSKISDRTTKDSKHWGTVYYMAPETFDGMLARQSDVYSFGVTLWQMVAGKKPWPDLHPGQVIIGVQSGSLALEWPTHVPARLVRLGEACLKHDRKERPTFAHVMKELTAIENTVRLEASMGSVSLSQQPSGLTGEYTSDSRNSSASAQPQPQLQSAVPAAAANAAEQAQLQPAAPATSSSQQELVQLSAPGSIHQLSHTPLQAVFESGSASGSGRPAPGSAPTVVDTRAPPVPETVFDVARRAWRSRLSASTVAARDSDDGGGSAAGGSGRAATASADGVSTRLPVPSTHRAASRSADALSASKKSRGSDTGGVSFVAFTSVGGPDGQDALTHTDGDPAQAALLAAVVMAARSREGTTAQPGGRGGGGAAARPVPESSARPIGEALSGSPPSDTAASAAANAAATPGQHVMEGCSGLLTAVSGAPDELSRRLAASGYEFGSVPVVPRHGSDTLLSPLHGGRGGAIEDLDLPWGVCGPGSEQSVGPTAPTEASSDYGSGQYNSQSMRQASGVNSHSRRTSSRAGSHISGPASHNACVSPADSNVCVRARRGSAYGEGQRSSL